MLSSSPYSFLIPFSGSKICKKTNLRLLFKKTFDSYDKVISPFNDQGRHGRLFYFVICDAIKPENWFAIEQDYAHASV